MKKHNAHPIIDEWGLVRCDVVRQGPVGSGKTRSGLVRCGNAWLEEAEAGQGLQDMTKYNAHLIIDEWGEVRRSCVR